MPTLKAESLAECGYYGHPLPRFSSRHPVAKNYSRSSVRIRDPYAFLTLNLFVEIFRTIKCYYGNRGSKEDRVEGRKNITWIRKMQGNFRILALAFDGDLEEFHQLCMKKINDIRQEAYESFQMEEQARRTEKN